MKPLYPDALQKLLSGNELHVELEASRPELRRWVTIFRYQRDGQWRYVVRSVEFRADLVEGGYDVAGTEENLIRHEVEDLQEAIMILADLVPHTVEWETGFDTECPI